MNEKVFTWTGEYGDNRKRAARETEPGVIDYDGLLFDGWGNVLGGRLPPDADDE